MLYLPAGMTAAFGYDARDLDGQPRAGLVLADFSVSLQASGDGVTYVPASEAVSLVESSLPGWYEFRFTPSLATRYVLTIAPLWLGHAAGETRVEALFVEPSVTLGGSYATRGQVKAYLGPQVYTDGDTSDDATLDELLAQATATIDEGCGRSFWQAQRTEFPHGGGVMLRLRHYPVASVQSVHLSRGVPRVYDASTLLVEGTDYLVDWDSGLLERVGCRWPEGTNAVRAIYTAGPAQVPALIARACVLLVCYWRANTRTGGYEAMSGPDGSVALGPNAAWYAEARAIIEAHRNPVLG